MFDPMTVEQIENYRRVLVGMIGPYALLMTPEQIQTYRDAFQRRINAEGRT